MTGRRTLATACPFCARPLGRAGESLECPACRTAFGWQDGILRLNANGHYYYGEIRQALMDRLVSQAGRSGWVRGFQDLLLALDPRDADALHQYVLDESRAAWKYLLRLRPDATVLDFGCGWGATTTSLARSAGRVVAMDLTLARLRFLQQRAAGQGLNNIEYVLGGDAPRLPFPDGTFDVVVLSGVLEWVPETVPGPPREVQLRFLREVRRILKPFGQLLLGIENRLSYRYFLGQPEDHTGLRFGALLPRRLADLYSRLVRGKPYRTYTYSLGGYRRLLRAAGFGGPRFYGPIPDYRNIFQILLFSRHDAPFDPRRPMTGLRRAKMAVLGCPPLTRHLTAAYAIVAGPPDAPSFIEELEADLRARLGPGFRAHTRSVLVRKAPAIVLKYPPSAADGAGVVVRLPLTPAAEARVRTHYQTLGQLLGDARLGPDLRALVPQPLALGFRDAQLFTVERWLPGLPGSMLPKAPRARLAVDAIRFLGRLHQFSAMSEPGTSSVVLDTIRATFQRIRELCGPGDGQLVDDVSGRVADELAGAEVVCGRLHGDFWAGNLLWDPRRRQVTGLVDWDSSVPRGVLLVDLLHYLYLESLDAGEAAADVLSRWLAEAFSPDELGALARYREAVALDARTLAPLLAFFAARTALQTHNAFDAANARAVLDPCLPLLRRYAARRGQAVPR